MSHVNVQIMINKDNKPYPTSILDKKRKSPVVRSVQVQANTSVPRSAMTIATSARKVHPNKWEAVMSKMAETKPRPINVKDVKSKVFLTTKVNVIPSHPSSAHRVHDKEQEDPLLKVNPKAPKLTPRPKSDRHNRLPKLIKETYSSQSSTISTSSEEHNAHLHKHSRLTKQSSAPNASTNSNSTGTVIRSACRSPAGQTPTKSPPNSSKGTPERIGSGKAKVVAGSQELQSLRIELLKERESRERTVHENKALRVEIKTLLEAQEDAIRERQTLQQELSTAEQRLNEARSDWDREREHAREESDSICRAHVLELQRLLQVHQAELYSLQERHQAEIQLLKASHKTDLNQLRASFEFREIEQEQKHDFEFEELKAKQLEELENIESHYKVEIELLQHKLHSYSPSPFSPSSKDSSTDLLHKEITSLSVVVELRNNEIKDLRQEVMSQRLELERLHGVDDQNQLLVQRVEDLDAQVQKTRDDKKKLIVENQTMQTSMHEAMTAKEKLSMQLDFLRYRIEETSDVPTHSIPQCPP